MLKDFGAHPADRVPKAELHAHLEGTIHAPVLRALAARNGLTLPEGVLDADDNYLWTDFNDFLKIYDMASSVIQTPEDYYDLTLDYLQRVAAEGGIYVELLTSPDHVSPQMVPVATAVSTHFAPWSKIRPAPRMLCPTSLLPMSPSDGSPTRTPCARSSR